MEKELWKIEYGYNLGSSANFTEKICPDHGMILIRKPSSGHMNIWFSSSILFTNQNNKIIIISRTQYIATNHLSFWVTSSARKRGYRARKCWNGKLIRIVPWWIDILCSLSNRSSALNPNPFFYWLRNPFYRLLSYEFSI